MNFGIGGFASDLQRITQEFEHSARTEPDIDIEIRDEFIDFDESDEEQIEKLEKKLIIIWKRKKSTRKEEVDSR